MFHTQEKWENQLQAPVPTTNENAWLGPGSYFWYYEEDAVWWGNTAKRKRKYYEIYSAQINCGNILDTVFNEDHYNLWIKYVDRALESFFKKHKHTLTLKYLNEYFRDKGIYDNVDGVLFQDISDNPNVWLIEKFQYKKRIQIAVYNLSIVSNFAHHFEGKCV